MIMKQTIIWKKLRMRSVLEESRENREGDGDGVQEQARHFWISGLPLTDVLCPGRRVRRRKETSSDLNNSNEVECPRQYLSYH